MTIRPAAAREDLAQKTGERVARAHGMTQLPIDPFAIAAAEQIGKRIAERAKAAGVEKVAFDRAGFAYHGRVKALADAAREAGLQF